VTEISSVLFYLVATFTLITAVAVIMVPNPLYSALLLVTTMLGVSAVYVTLEAYFIAGAQLIIYAGAVMVLFVMVVMLINLKEEKQAFSGGPMGFIVKMAASGFLLGLFVSSVTWVIRQGYLPDKSVVADGMDATKKIAIHLFTKYVFAFELTGVLLLVVLVGAIALARSKGGTHA